MTIKYDALSRGALALRTMLLTVGVSFVYKLYSEQIIPVPAAFRSEATTASTGVLIFLIEIIFVLLTPRLNTWEINRRIKKIDGDVARLSECLHGADAKTVGKINKKIAALAMEKVSLIG